jgi:hypothetical protein
LLGLFLDSEDGGDIFLRNHMKLTELMVSCLAYSSNLKMEAICASETNMKEVAMLVPWLILPT